VLEMLWALKVGLKVDVQGVSVLNALLWESALA
jgi:hypothetical protein